MSYRLTRSAAFFTLFSLAACKHGETGDGAAASASASAEAAPIAAPGASSIVMHAAPREWTQPAGDALGAIIGQVNVFAGTSTETRRLGYLRLGAMVNRDHDPVGKATCAGGWYKIQPRGDVCVGEEATLDMQSPILKAAARLRPNLTAAMPYRYGFVRAVLPLYLKVPSKADQIKSEMSLKEHLEKWDSNKDELNKVILGSFDVPVDGRGVPIVSKKVGDVPNPSTGLGQGVLFGGDSDDDPIPFWLDGGRKIPNMADFKVPEYAMFADRARRHTGLAFVGSFQMGDDGFNRRFGITTDLRLAPTSKVKPDTGSPWHGLELLDPAKSPPLPFAFVRTSGVNAYRFGDSDHPSSKGDLDKRSIVLLTGKKRKGYDGFYWEMKNGSWIRAGEAGVVKNPDEWPEAAKKGLKWVEVSIDNQTLILWEGQKPVYATLVSTGRDGAKDPKTTLSTVQGTFQIRSKHITATMDSNERSGAGGGKKPEVASPSKGGGDDSDDEKHESKPKKHDGVAKGDKDKDAKGKGSSKSAKETKVGKPDSKVKAETKGDHPDGYGVTKRRGEGSFWLRDVPYVQYFESAYALHVAYWHDVFGIARSHGCINLSPIDGKWIFAWTDPPVPDDWHGVYSGPEMGEGTTVIVHELETGRGSIAAL